MAEIIKVGMLGIVGVLIAVQFRGQKPEYSVCIGISIGVLIFCYALKEFQAVFERLTQLRSFFGTGEGYLGILLKVIGITYICEFSASVCKDAGYGTVAEQIEVLGKLAVMFAGLPIIMAVIEQIQTFLG